MSWVGPLILLATLASIVLGTLHLLAAHARITGRRDADGDGDGDGGAAS